jgi:hypothetical protein
VAASDVRVFAGSQVGVDRVAVHYLSHLIGYRQTGLGFYYAEEE